MGVSSVDDSERGKGLTFTELSVHLSSQNMEQIGWGSHISDLHVAVLMLAFQFIWGRIDAGIFVAQLEVSLHTSRRMLRSLSIIAVGQRHDETRSLHPLDFTGSDKLIDDALGVVSKVTELGFPDDQGIR